MTYYYGYWHFHGKSATASRGLTRDEDLYRFSSKRQRDRWATEYPDIHEAITETEAKRRVPEVFENSDTPAMVWKRYGVHEEIAVFADHTN